MNKENRLVSIIVPVYNAEGYLCKCIDSVMSQTYSNWELVLIDDGSKDNSRNICEDYKLKDDRIYVIYKDNSGVSDTRNVGIKHASGDSICFVDADDWIKPRFLEHLMQYSEYDYVAAGYETWPENSKCILQEQSYNRNEMPLYFDKYLQTRPTSCATLFNAEIVKMHKIQFTTKLRSREDHLFNVQYLRWCDSAKVINHQEYIVRSRRVPIAIKFRMHSEDITLVIDSLLKGYRDIKQEFGYKTKDLRPTLNIMSQYYLEDFIRFKSDDDYFGLYCRYFNTTDKKKMYADSSLNSMNLMLDGIIAYKQVKNKTKMQELIGVFLIIFQGVNTNNVSFRSKYYQKIAEAILRRQQRKTESEINKVCCMRAVDYFVKKNLRPIVYGMKRVVK